MALKLTLSLILGNYIQTRPSFKNDQSCEMSMKGQYQLKKKIVFGLGMVDPYFPRIHIHLKFLFIKFVSVNNHRGVFMRLDTLTENILTKRMHRLG